MIHRVTESDAMSDNEWQFMVPKMAMIDTQRVTTSG